MRSRSPEIPITSDPWLVFQIGSSWQGVRHGCRNRHSLEVEKMNTEFLLKDLPTRSNRLSSPRHIQVVSKRLFSHTMRLLIAVLPLALSAWSTGTAAAQGFGADWTHWFSDGSLDDLRLYADTVAQKTSRRTSWPRHHHPGCLSGHRQGSCGACQGAGHEPTTDCLEGAYACCACC